MDDEILDDLVEIFVETLTGSCIAIECYNSDTVQFLKQRVWEYEGIPVDQQCLIYHDQELADHETITDCRLLSGCSVKLVPRAKAGPANLPSIFSSLPKDTSKISSAEIEYLLKQGDLTIFPADDSNPSSRYVAVRDGDSYRVLQVVETLSSTNTSRPQTSKANSASLSETENADIDLTFTEERRASALQRAKDNMRTMQKMQELRRTMERLNFERGRRRQQVFQSEDSVAIISPRQRRSSGKAKECVPSTSSKKFQRGLSAPEDTSAKESSAGETEYEDLQKYQPLPNCPNCRAVRVGAEKTRYFGVPKPSKMVMHQHIKSSSSERDQDSSVQDVDLSDNDLLFTADEQFGNENFVDEIGDSEELEENEDYKGEYYEDEEDEEDPDDYLSAESREICCKNPENTEGQPEAAISELSEFSSGMIMCELPEARRPKIRRKHPKLPGSRVQPRPPSIAETDEQSATEEIGYQKFNLKPPGMYVQMIRKPRELVRQSSDPQAIQKGAINLANGTCPFHSSSKWKQQQTYHTRVSKSKPRTKPGKSKKSTGESSSDEPENKSSSVQLSSSFGCDQQSNASWRHGKAPVSTSSNVRKVSASTIDSNRRAQFRQTRRCSADKAPKIFSPPTMWMQYGAASCSPQVNVGAIAAVAGPNGGANGFSIGGSAVKHSHKAPQSSQSQQRCNTCGYKLSIATTFQCRCGKTVCSRHRNAEMHNCSYDFKGEGRRQLAKDFGGAGVSGCATTQRLPKL